MNKLNKIFGMLILMTAAAIMISSSYLQDPKPWEVPAKYKNMENPEKASNESIKMGRMVYNKNCASCHGKAGLGDGAKARGLETFPGDFTSEHFQSQTDGEHFYKTKFGRNEMPKYEKKIADEDIWNMVNFMNSLEK